VRSEPQHAKPEAPARRMSRRISRRWVVIALITAAVAVLAPGISYATASQNGPALASCRGVRPVTFPASGFITDPGRTQGGHTWWRHEANGSICIGTVVEFVQYTATATKTWRVTAFWSQHPDGQVVASGTFTLNRGWYLSLFRVREAFPGLTRVCITASDSFGASCLRFS